MLFACAPAFAQKAPAAPDHPWDVTTTTRQMQIPPRPTPSVTLDATKVYTLPELVDVAEHNNPDTRVSWENAKARAADLGISKSTLYPTLAAVVLADTARNGIFFGPYFVRQTVESYAPTFVVDYAIFDLQRSQEIAISRNKLLVANFQFNDTHRKIIFQVMDAYYRLLDTKGQQEAAEANLKNAQTVRRRPKRAYKMAWRLCPTCWNRAAPRLKPITICRPRSARPRSPTAIWLPRLVSRR